MHGLFQWLRGISLLLLIYGILFVRILAAQEVMFVLCDLVFSHSYRALRVYVVHTKLASIVYARAFFCVLICLKVDLNLDLNISMIRLKKKYRMKFDCCYCCCCFYFPLTSRLLCTFSTILCNPYGWFTSNLIRFMIRTANLLVIIYNAISISPAHILPLSAIFRAVNSAIY